jgi:hypothetical protein
LPWISGVKKQRMFRGLPRGIHKDIRNSKQNVFLSTQTTWSTFRVTSDRNFWTEIRGISVEPRFPKFESLNLMRALIEIIAFVATVKPSLDSSVYKDIKHAYRIKINCLVSIEAKMANRNITLWIASIINVGQIKFCTFLSFSNFGSLRKFLCSTSCIDKRPVSLLAFNNKTFSHWFEQFRIRSTRQDTINGQKWEFWTGTLRFNNKLNFHFKSFSSSEMSVIILLRLWRRIHSNCD